MQVRDRFRGSSVIVLLMLMLAFAAACSSVTEQPSGGSSGEEAGKNVKTRVYTDDMGREVEIPTAPQKAVVCEFSPIAITVGVQPAAVCNNDFKNSFSQSSLVGIDSIGDPPNAEKIVSISPDLMIFSSVYPEIYPEIMGKIEKIAPVVYVEFKDPIYEIFPKVANVLGKQSMVDGWIKDYEAEMHRAREKVKKAIGDETVSILRIEKGRIRAYLSTNFGGYVVRTALQARAVDGVQQEIDKDRWKNAVVISQELLPEYVGDHLFLVVEEESEYKEIQKSALWKELPAVKNGKVHLLDPEKYYNMDILTIRETMKEVAELLAS